MINPDYLPARDDDAEWAVLSGIFAAPPLLNAYEDDVVRPENYWHPVAKIIATGLGYGIPPDSVAMGRYVDAKSGKDALDLCGEKV